MHGAAVILGKTSITLTHAFYHLHVLPVCSGAVCGFGLFRNVNETGANLLFLQSV